MSSTPLRARVGTSLVCLAMVASLAVGLSARAADEEFNYHTVLRDTLIGIGRRLLVDPRRWREVQQRNHISNANRIPPGTTLHIPYSWLRMSGESATVTSVGGAVAQGKTGINVGDVLTPGAVIDTGTDGSLTLQMADGSSVTLQKSSTLILEEMARVTGVSAAHSIRLKLDAGRLETEVKPHRDVGRFEIVTPIAVAAVRGTQFRDSFDAAGAHGTTETLVGSVAVAGGSDTVAVSAGFGTRVEESRPPLQPVPLLPPPNIAALAGVHTTPDLELNWQGVKGASAYRVQLSSDAEFHSIRADMKLAEPRATIRQLADGDYWLRIRAIDRFDIEGRDSVSRMVQHMLPTAPQPTAPRQAEKLAARPTRFAWTGDNNADAFRLQISSDRSFAPSLIEAGDIHGTQLELPAMPPGTYFWRVAAANSQGEWSPWSSLQSFTQRSEPPAPAVSTIGAKQIHLAWRAQPGARYQVEMSRHHSFSHVILDQKVDTAEITLKKPLPGIYYVRVREIDADGGSGPLGEAARFVVPVPGWVGIAIPVAIILSLAL